MDFGATLAASMALPRTEAVELRCHACHRATPVGISEIEPQLPMLCVHCGGAVPDNHVLLANLLLARRETDQLANSIGVLFGALAVIARDHPRALRNPVEVLERVVDQIALGANAPCIARLHEGVFAKRRGDQ